MTNEKEIIYKPTITEIYYWRAYADPYIGASRAAAANKAVELMAIDGLKDIPLAESIRQMTYQWEEKEGYKEWRDSFWKDLMNENRIILDKIGIQRGTENFRYWEAMQMKYGGFKRKADFTTDDKPINNTDNIANLLMEAYKNGGAKGGATDTEKGGDSEAKPGDGEPTQDPSI